jgi:DNA polymerase III sliding clamp (beta) subunit (PCNA family)
VKVKREDFLAKLESVQAGLTPKDVIEQSSCFVFRGGRVFTYDQELACSCPIKVDKKFTGAVFAKPLIAILRKLHEDELDIEPTGEIFVIKGKRRQTEVRMESEIHLPLIDVGEKPQWKKLHSEFSQATDLVANCASKDENHLFNYVHITPRWVEACDNVQIARYRIKMDLKESILIRRNSIRHVSEMDMVEFAESDQWIHFRNVSGVILSCRRYVEPYRDLDSIIKVTGGTPTVFPKGLAEAAENAGIFSEDNPDDKQDRVLVEIKPGKVRITGEGAYGRHREWTPLKYKGTPMAFLVTPKLLGDLVRGFGNCEMYADRLKVDGGKFVYVARLKKHSKNGEQSNAEEQGSEG